MGDLVNRGDRSLGSSQLLENTLKVAEDVEEGATILTLVKQCSEARLEADHKVMGVGEANIEGPNAQVDGLAIPGFSMVTRGMTESRGTLESDDQEVVELLLIMGDNGIIVGAALNSRGIVVKHGGTNLNPEGEGSARQREREVPNQIGKRDSITPIDTLEDAEGCLEIGGKRIRPGGIFPPLVQSRDVILFGNAFLMGNLGKAATLQGENRVRWIIRLGMGMVVQSRDQGTALHISDEDAHVGQIRGGWEGHRHTLISDDNLVHAEERLLDIVMQLKRRCQVASRIKGRGKVVTETEALGMVPSSATNQLDIRVNNSKFSHVGKKREELGCINREKGMGENGVEGRN